MRTNGRGLILKVFTQATIDEHTDKDDVTGIESYNQNLAEQIEREVLKLNKRIISKPYRRHMRRIAMAMQHDSTILESVLSGETDPTELAEQTFSSKNNLGLIGQLLFNENKLDEIK